MPGVPGPESMLAVGERESASRRGSPGSSAGERRSTMLERQSRLDRALLCSAAYPAAGGDTHTTGRDTKDSALQRGPALPAPSAAGSGGGPPASGSPPPPPRFPPPLPRLGLTVGHVGAVDGVEAAASRRPDGAATVGL